MTMNDLTARTRCVEYQYCLPLLNCIINICVITMEIQVYCAYLGFIKSPGLDALYINIVALA
jgi:hypothetical protein